MEKLRATQMLRDDHKTVKGLFRQFEVIDERAHEMKRGVVSQIFMLLEVHSRVEETIFYPSLESVVDANGRAILDDARKEHESVNQLITDLRKMNVDAVDYDAKFKEMIEQVEEHVDKEEGILFPVFDNLETEKNLDLSAQMKELKEQLTNSPEYKMAQPMYTQDPNGGEQMRKREAS